MDQESELFFFILNVNKRIQNKGALARCSSGRLCGELTIRIEKDLRILVHNPSKAKVTPINADIIEKLKRCADIIISKGLLLSGAIPSWVWSRPALVPISRRSSSMWTVRSSFQLLQRKGKGRTENFLRVGGG